MHGLQRVRPGLPDHHPRTDSTKAWPSRGPPTSYIPRRCPTPLPSKSGESPPAGMPARRASGPRATSPSSGKAGTTRRCGSSRKTIPFPGICGRICNHRCEDACNRNLVDNPLSIAALKRFVADRVYSEPYLPPDPLALSLRGEGRHHRRGALRLDRRPGPAQTGLPGHHLRGAPHRRRHAPGGGARLPPASPDRGPGSAGDHRPGHRPAAQFTRYQPG